MKRKKDSIAYPDELMCPVPRRPTNNTPTALLRILRVIFARFPGKKTPLGVCARPLTGSLTRSVTWCLRRKLVFPLVESSLSVAQDLGMRMPLTLTLLLDPSSISFLNPPSLIDGEAGFVMEGRNTVYNSDEGPFAFTPSEKGPETWNHRNNSLPFDSRGCASGFPGFRKPNSGTLAPEGLPIPPSFVTGNSQGCDMPTMQATVDAAATGPASSPNARPPATLAHTSISRFEKNDVHAPPFKFNAMAKPFDPKAESHEVTPLQRKAAPTFTTFHPFPFLPAEIRERVYEYALNFCSAIRPQLCNEGSAIRFHDANHSEHNAVFRQMAVTRVSRLVRNESLKVFYGCNIFTCDIDTAIFFERLTHLGLFGMIRHVDVQIPFYYEEYGAKVLSLLRQNIKAQEQFQLRFETNYRSPYTLKTNTLKTNTSAVTTMISNIKKIMTSEKANNATTDYDFWAERHGLETFKKHPAYAAIDPDTGLFVVLRKLSARAGSGRRALTLHVPTASLLAEPNLVWFTKVMEGLDIDLNLVEGADLVSSGGQFKVSWHQKLQRRDLKEADERMAIPVRRQIMEKALKIFPKMMSWDLPRRSSYYRRGCHGGIEWFDVDLA
ncbi:uncharacterized protein BDR25DRAFT_342205 [Lindgomyces ingoldianus]|uniref:Uncharacterized protein n=1 Tax=Lindgomyces ingoldianus TaxID=673940 RepID=A0ACB6QYU9_9PLEO|nr:uncharacterized protein BDR25DRAFT_342205 [Lindgomyces ingoldianus]KAF2472234.1 hypothetical protein BDR25DRAFT_342205 [Lindgomyces ingoldianus]